MKVPKVLRIVIEADLGATSPADEEGSWTVVTFNESHHSQMSTDCERNEYFDEDNNPHDPTLADKLKNGLAFGLEGSTRGGSCLFELRDSTENGILVWNNDEDDLGAKTVEDRRADAQDFLDEYNDWANGCCHRVEVHKIKSIAPDFDPNDPTYNGAYWDLVANDGGYIGAAPVQERVDELKDEYPDHKIIISGDGEHLVS